MLDKELEGRIKLDSLSQEEEKYQVLGRVEEIKEKKATHSLSEFHFRNLFL